MHAILLAVLAALPSPRSESAAAAADVARLAAADRPFARYLTVYASPTPADDVPVLRFWLNSLSLRKRIAAPVQLSPTLHRIDLRDLGDPRAVAEAWEDLAKLDPYFCSPWLGVEASALSAATGSAGPILRVDWFVAKTSIEPQYSKFLGLGKTVAEVQQLLGVRAGDVERLSLNAGGAVLQSIVALHNRQLERYPALAGYWWESRDVNANVGQRNVLQQLEGITPDGGEYIFSLPNGLQGYYLSDGAGNQVATVPEEIAIDAVTAFQSKTVTNARSCVVCHDAGLRPFRDVVSRLIRESPAKVIDSDKLRAIRVEEFYLAKLQEQLAADQARYAAAVKAVNGLDPAANARDFEILVHGYFEGRVDAAVAARELGVADIRPIAAQSTDATIVAIAAGEAVARDAWEAAFPGVATLLHNLPVEVKQ